MSSRPYGDIYDSESNINWKSAKFEENDWKKGFRFKRGVDYARRKSVRRFLFEEKVDWKKILTYNDYLKEFNRELRRRTMWWPHTQDSIRPITKWQYYYIFSMMNKNSSDEKKRNRARWYSDYLFYTNFYKKRWTYRQFQEYMLNPKLTMPQVRRIANNKLNALIKRNIKLNKK